VLETNMDSLLVDANWLQKHLGDSSVHVIDTRVDIVPRPPGPSDYVSRYNDYIDCHIPGAAYLHMVDDLSDPNGSFPFALPSYESVSQCMSNLGVSPGDRVVVYGDQIHWATHRCWWVLAVAGVDVKLLNMSFSSWVEAARPVEQGQISFTSSEYTAEPNVSWVADKETVQASLDRPDIALVNALSAEQFAGRGQPFGRAGRIPGSISVPSATLIDRTSGAFRPIDELAKAFDVAGASSYNQLITYCGGGIAASTTFVALRLLGYENVALYDGSLLEWSSDLTLPLLVD
jgi:thiosulfate/3-mercaptopyruvate sulfurtransferase